MSVFCLIEGSPEICRSGRVHHAPVSRLTVAGKAFSFLTSLFIILKLLKIELSYLTVPKSMVVKSLFTYSVDVGVEVAWGNGLAYPLQCQQKVQDIKLNQIKV